MHPKYDDSNTMIDTKIDKPNTRRKLSGEEADRGTDFRTNVGDLFVDATCCAESRLAKA